MTQTIPVMSFDKGSVRSVDVDGRLHVAVSNISMEQVAPYLGKEIVDFEKMGLDPETVYQLYRPGEELEKAAATFNNVPLLSEHVPVSAADHRPDLVVGATGSDAEYVAPYLRNSLVIWAADAIEGIESGEQRELSCAYRYTPVFEAGSFNGQPYQIRMTDLIANHVAIVAAGRAGPTVTVGDSQLEKEIGMTKVKAIARKAAALRGAFLVSPKFAAFAADAKVNPIVSAITQANWKTERPKLEAAIKPKLAADADMQDLVKLLDAVEKAEEGMDDEPAAAPPAVDGDPIAEIMAMLKGKVSDEELAAMGEKLKAMKPAAAADAPPPPAPAPAPAPGGEKDKDMVSKSAMDAALKTEREKAKADIKQAADAARAEAEGNTIKRLHAIREAEDAVHPYVGKLSGAFDSAEGVYRAALTAMKVDHDGVHESALRKIVEAHPKPGTAPMARDSQPSTDVVKRFPALASVRTL